MLLVAVHPAGSFGRGRGILGLLGIAARGSSEIPQRMLQMGPSEMLHHKINETLFGRSLGYSQGVPHRDLIGFLDTAEIHASEDS